MVSAFRNARGYLDRYFRQIAALKSHAGPAHHIRVVAMEGDSRDDTPKYLRQPHCVPVEVVTYNHGLREFSSTEDRDRLSALTRVMTTGMAAVLDTDDVVLYVESDLVWEPHQVGSIIDLAYRREDGFDILSPLVFAGSDFYDVWGFRGLDEERFAPYPPYHSQLQPAGITEVSSAGSCLAFRAEVAWSVEPIGEEGLVSWCRGARELGMRVGVAADFRVYHP